MQPNVSNSQQQPAPQAPQTPNAPAQNQKQPVTGSKPQKKAPPPPKNPHSTQNSLLFSEIRDDIIIMADGSFRGVVRCKSINFDLMSNREREGVEYSYQNFLNSLNHQIQILVRSRRVDIGPYLDKLSEMRRSQNNMLLGVLMDDYIDFIDILSQEANIMAKDFYVVVPSYPDGNIGNFVDQGKGFFGKLFARPEKRATKIDSATYDKAKTEIKNRVDGIIDGLFQIGVQCKQLNTKELGEMYYDFYNPDTALYQPLGNFTESTNTFVQKAQAEAPKTGVNNG